MARLPVSRRQLDAALDRVRFTLDTAPQMDYQPLPWIGKHTARRDDGVHARWATIEAILDDVKPVTAVDIGAQVGFFTFAMASRGITTVAVEREPHFYRTLLFARQRMNLTNVGLLAMAVEPDTVDLLPHADVTMYMSVWHHNVRTNGVEVARDMLTRIWDGTRSALFFETGENEMPAYYGLPDMGPDPKAWITDLLTEQCPGGTIEHLGLHAAFAPDETRCMRNLFVVRRGA